MQEPLQALLPVPVLIEVGHNILTVISLSLSLSLTSLICAVLLPGTPCTGILVYLSCGWSLQLVLKLRAHYYFFMSVLEDEEAQRRGVISVTYVVGNPRVDGHIFWNCARIAMSFPLKFRANHLCYDRIHQVQALTLGMIVMPRASQVRSRVHSGTYYLLLMRDVKSKGRVPLEQASYWR